MHIYVYIELDPILSFPQIELARRSFARGIALGREREREREGREGVGGGREKETEREMDPILLFPFCFLRLSWRAAPSLVASRSSPATLPSTRERERGR